MSFKSEYLTGTNKGSRFSRGTLKEQTLFIETGLNVSDSHRDRPNVKRNWKSSRRPMTLKMHSC